MWAPQRKTTDAAQDGSQQQEQSGYQTQWYSFHLEDTCMTSQSPPTQEELVQEAAKALGGSLRTLATNNPTYTHLSNFSILQQISDIINSAAKKYSDDKTQERQRVTPPKIPGGKRVGPNIIEDDR